MVDRSFQEYRKASEDNFERSVVEALRQLMQSKHLYQSVLLRSPFLATAGNKEAEATAKAHSPALTAMVDGPWFLQRPPVAITVQRVCVCKPPDLKLFCQNSSCERIEAYNLVYATELLKEFRDAGQEFKSPKGEIEQAFLFGYQCQSCKGTPEYFLIRRRGLRLTNEARSPIEHVAVPDFLPKSMRRFYVGAILAYQSGHALPGLFMLRTLIEQWARSVTESTHREADRLMEEYMETLPPDFRDRFYSMRKLYEELSADLHGAVGSDPLFDQACAEINQHFDARRLYRLPDKRTAPPAKS